MRAAFLAAIGGLALMASPARADEIKFGAHTVYLLGGDLLEDNLGYGAQVQAYVNDALSLELAGTQFTDDNAPGLTVEHLNVAATLRLSGRPARGIEVYAGGGANYDLPVITFAAEPRDSVPAAIGYHFCGGVALEILEHFDLFAEYRGLNVAFQGTLGAYEAGLVFLGVLFPM